MTSADFKAWLDAVPAAAWALLGALVGAAVAAVGGILLEGFKRKRDRDGAAMSIAGAMEAGMDITKRQNYVPLFRTVVDHISTTGQLPPWWRPPVVETGNPLLEEHLKYVGSFGPRLSYRIAKQVITSRSLILDLNRLKDEADPQRVKFLLSNGLSIWAEAEPQGRQLIHDLRTLPWSGLRRGAYRAWTLLTKPSPKPPGPPAEPSPTPSLPHP